MSNFKIDAIDLMADISRNSCEIAHSWKPQEVIDDID